MLNEFVRYGLLPVTVEDSDSKILLRTESRCGKEWASCPKTLQNRWFEAVLGCSSRLIKNPRDKDRNNVENSHWSRKQQHVRDISRGG